MQIKNYVNLVRTIKMINMINGCLSIILPEMFLHIYDIYLLYEKKQNLLGDN